MIYCVCVCVFGSTIFENSVSFDKCVVNQKVSAADVRINFWINNENGLDSRSTSGHLNQNCLKRSCVGRTPKASSIWWTEKPCIGAGQTLRSTIIWCSEELNVESLFWRHIVDDARFSVDGLIACFCIAQRLFLFKSHSFGSWMRLSKFAQSLRKSTPNVYAAVSGKIDGLARKIFFPPFIQQTTGSDGACECSYLPCIENK